MLDHREELDGVEKRQGQSQGHPEPCSPALDTSCGLAAVLRVALDAGVLLTGEFCAQDTVVCSAAFPAGLPIEENVPSGGPC